MPQPIFYLLAGPNGAGKSSLYRAALAAGLIPAEAEFVNADLHEAAGLQHIADPQLRSEAARQWADERRAALLTTASSFVSETVFSHPSKLSLMVKAQQSGYVVVLLVVCLDNTDILLERVRQRVLEGGHDVPLDRVLARYPRTLQNLSKAVRQADMALLYDTGSRVGNDINPPVRIAVCQRLTTKILVETLPEWARIVLGGAEIQR